MNNVTIHLRSWVSQLVLLLLATSPALAEEASVMVLEGTTVAPRDNGDFMVFDPKLRWNQAKLAEWKKTAQPGEWAPMEALGGIAQAPIGPGGKFRLEVAVDEPRTVYFSVLNARTPEGMLLGPVKMGNNFILEPGELTFRGTQKHYFVITGGYYNDAVYNSWRLSDKNQAEQLEYVQLQADVEDEPEQAKRLRWDRMMEAQARVLRLEGQGMAKVALTHPDPLVRRLTIESTWQFGPWVLEALRALAKLTPEDPWVIRRLAATEASFKKEEEERQLTVGETVVDFTAETLSGETVTLADLRSNSRYLLIEFWASWCGSCRVEFPHMKQAYERFLDEGFEIASFTIDEEREDWEEASATEDLPWFDLGMGPDAEAPTAYNVVGVPNSYLVDSQTGEIVAKNLRRHKLDEKLEELLN